MDDQQAARQVDKVAEDLLAGGREIAAFLGTNLREVYHLHKTKRLPIGRPGRKLIASRRQLTRAAKALTAA
jgi:hypothetical protein